MPIDLQKVSYNNMILSGIQFFFLVLFLAIYICNASKNKAPKGQTYKSCENAHQNQFLPRNCPVSYDRLIVQDIFL